MTCHDDVVDDSVGNVLVLDRSRFVAEVLVEGLRRCGVAARAVLWGESCADRLVSVALLDGDGPRPAVLAAAVALRRGCADVRVLLLVQPAHPAPRALCAAVGAAAWLDREMPLRGVRDAIVQASRSDRVRCSSSRQVPGDAQSAVDRLSGREREVLRLLWSGAHNDEVAAALGISASTVRTHLQSTFVKLGVTSRLAAVTVAREGGLWDEADQPTGTAGLGAP